MERATVEKMKELYAEHQRLHTVGEVLGIPWQTVCWWLKKEGVSVTGNKARYGGNSDKIAVIGENLFGKLGTDAINQNNLQFQSKYDYILGDLKIDIKTGFLRDQKGRGNSKITRWAFCTKVQQKADYLICYCLSGTLDEYRVEYILLIPAEFIGEIQTISVSPRNSKWLNFTVSEDELKSFLLEA